MTNEEYDLNKLLKLTKAELITMCREQHKPTTGTKQDLARRITSVEIPQSQIDTFEPEPVIRIEKNEQGHYVHRPTQLVFSPVHRWVIGRLTNDGQIRPLRRQDIQMCHKYKFNYARPDTIDDDDIIYEILENEYDNFNGEHSDSDHTDNTDVEDIDEDDIDVSENEMI